jgi:hypothetical protein
MGSGEYTLSGCDPIVCARPLFVRGYTTDEANLDLTAGPFAVTATCAAGFEGTATASACLTAGGEYGLSGCLPIVCTAPTAATLSDLGYTAEDPEALTVVDLGTVSCLDTYAQADAAVAPFATCHAVDAAFSLSGCLPRAECSTACLDYTDAVAVNGYDYKAGYTERQCIGAVCTQEDDVDTCCIMLPPPGSLTAALVLAMAIEGWDDSMETQLLIDLAALLGLDSARLAFQSINGGSIVVSFLFLAPEAMSSATALVTIMETQPERLASSSILSQIDLSVPMSVFGPDGSAVDVAASVEATGSPSVDSSSSSAAVETPASIYDTPAPNFKDRTGVVVMVLIALMVWVLVAGVAFVVLRAHHNRKMQEEDGDVESGGKESLDDFLNQTRFSNPLAADDDDDEASMTPSMEHLRVGAAADDEALTEIRKLQHELTQSKINEARLQEEVGALRGEGSPKSHTSFKGAVFAVEATSTRRRLTRAEPVRSKAKNGSNQLFMLQQGDVVNVLKKNTGKDGVARIKVSLDSKDPANKDRGKHHGKAGWIREKDRKGVIAESASE